MSVSHIVGAEIPALRRFARALTGSQRSGDAYVTETLQSLVADPTLISRDGDVRARLYELFLTMWNAVAVNREASPSAGLEGVDRNLQTISPGPRQAFLLTALEGFSAETAARIMRIPVERCQELIDQAGREIAEQMASDVLIIEDEPLIALEVADIARSMGHTVRHVARTYREAIAAAGKYRPQLVLADIQLADGSSGMEAVQEILRSLDIPVVFITAFPERLLTGARPEPTYLAAKPFRPETIKALISQALFFHAPRS